THALELLGKQLGLRCFERQAVDHGQTILTGELRQDGSNTGAIHLAVDLLAEILFRSVREDATAATPQRAGGHTGTGVTRTLLLERLLGAVMHFGTGQLLAVAGAGIRLVSNNQLMNQRLVVLARKQRVGSTHGRRRLAIVID